MKTLKPIERNTGLTLILLLTLLAWAGGAIAYDSVTNRGNSVTVDVKPVQLAAGQPATFEIRMNTHSVALDQDLVTVSTLQDDQGKTYQPVNWQGSAPGGHHRLGVLSFPALGSGVKSVKLIIRKVAGIPERAFEWRIGR